MNDRNELTNLNKKIIDVENDILDRKKRMGLLYNEKEDTKVTELSVLKERQSEIFREISKNDPGSLT